MESTWLMVANSTIARFFELDKNGNLTEIETLVHPEGRLHGRDLTSDRPGRSYESSNPSRHAMEPSTSPKEVEFEIFAKDISNHLHNALNEGRYSRLQIAASPHFLGLLRQVITGSTAKAVSREIDKDMTQLKADEIKQYLKQ
jgi:protein required for attachment to host cells